MSSRALPQIITSQAVPITSNNLSIAKKCAHITN